MLFDSNLIKGNGTRLVAAVMGIIPIVLIFAANALWRTSTSAAQSVQGRPSPWFFAFVWSIICMVLVFLTTLVAFRATYSGSSMYVSFVITLLGVTSALWIYIYNGRKNKANSVIVMGTVVFVGMWLLTSLLGTTFDNPSGGSGHEAECTKLVASGLCTIPVAWALYALILGFIDAQT